MTPQEFKQQTTTLASHVDPIMWLLFAGIVFFTLLLVAISKWSPNDGQTFQVLSGLLTGFAGAFFGRMKPSGAPEPARTPEVKP